MIALAREPSKRFAQQTLHAVSWEVLLEELLCLDALINEIRYVEHNVPALQVEHALAGLTEISERLHRVVKCRG